MIARRSRWRADARAIASVQSGATTTSSHTSTIRLDQRLLRRWRQRRAIERAYAWIDRFVFEPTPRQHRIWNAILVGIGVVITVHVIIAAHRGGAF